MIIRLAKHSGFCFGVRRAIQLAVEAVQEGQPVYSLGELIHNPQYVQEMESRGVRVASSAESLHDSTVIIRSHGITKQQHEKLLEQGNIVIDATCPYVSKTHELIRQANIDGYPVLILGDAEYKESPIIANSDHLDKIDKSKRQKNIRRAFAEDHLDIVLVNFPVLITKTCKLDTILSKW